MDSELYKRALARLEAPFDTDIPMSVAMAYEIADMKPLLRALLVYFHRGWHPKACICSACDDVRRKISKFAGGEDA